MGETPNLKFEGALQRLEEIVKRLESGDLPLDEALCLFEEGVKLSAHCSSLLDNAEKTIQVVTQLRDGSVSLSDVKAGS